MQAARGHNGPMARLGGQQGKQQFGQEASQNRVRGQEYEQAPMQNQREQQLTPEKAKLIQGIFESPEERAKKEKAEFEQEKFAHAEKVNTLKETKQYVDTLKE